MKRSGVGPIAVLVTAHPVDDMRVLHREARSMCQWADVTVLGLAGCSVLPANGLRVVVLEGRSSRAWRILVAPWRLVRRAIADGATVLHVHDPEILPAAMTLGHVHGVRWVFDDHENYPEVMLSKDWLPVILRRPARRGIEVLYRLVARGAALVITPTESLAEEFRRMGASVAVVRNFPPKGVFSMDPARLPGMSSRRFDVIHLGTISSLRLDAFVELIVEVDAARPGTKWRIVGLREDPLNRLRLALPPSVAPNVSFEGVVPASRVPLELADACVGVNWHPDLEQFRTAIPNKVPEYLAMGLPVVTTEIPELRTLLPEGRTDEHGVRYADRGIRQFAAAVGSCINDARDGRTPSVDAIAHYAATHLTWEVEAGSLRSAYERALWAHAVKEGGNRL